ncbi:MAG TPA: tryptophan 2,3-dioxygenase family protein [Rhodothermales bacterium]|nr:tryptophan 2,3-dioxygenase family protein [Rhodothermales bacterium]
MTQQPVDPLYYSDYLQLDRILDAQELESARHGRPAHDEMLFIVVHQAYELWFKQILWDLDSVLEIFDRTSVPEGSIGMAVSRLTRIVGIQRLMLEQITVLETMTPLDFLDFRDFLIPASGFQSLQFRLLESKLGLRDEDRITDDGSTFRSRLNAVDRAVLAAEASRPSLFDLIQTWLARTPFPAFGDFDFWSAYRRAVTAMLVRDEKHIRSNPTLADVQKQVQLKGLEATREHFDAVFDERKHDALVSAGRRRLSHRAFQAALLINLYRDQPILHLPFRLLTVLMDVDETLTNWRQRHALMAMRMIGTRIGTGGSSGHEYLRRSAEASRVFHDLINLTTFLIPRSELPVLPESVARSMGFTLDANSDSRHSDAS